MEIVDRSTKRVRSFEYLAWQRNQKKRKYLYRKQKALDILGGKCVTCHATEDLHLDHIDRKSKSFPISRAPSDKAFWEELKKCQILCKKCHRWKSSKENSGENCYAAKLTREKVKEILKLLQSGVSQAQIARKFEVSPMTISRIKNGQRWMDVKNEA